MLVKTKVLIAEENQDFLDKMCSLLAECGFEMVSAPKDGLQLVDRIQTERPGIVLMDVFLRKQKSARSFRLAAESCWQRS